MQEPVAPGVSVGELTEIPSSWVWGLNPCRGWGQWPEKSFRIEGPSPPVLGDVNSYLVRRWVRVSWSWCFREGFSSLVWAGFGDETKDIGSISSPSLERNLHTEEELSHPEASI